MNEVPSRRRVGGMLVGYYLVCPRKAWLSMHGLWMEQESEAVQMGRLLDRTSYSRRRRPAMIEAEAPDGTHLVARLDGVSLRDGVLHEVKKGRSCEEAHLWQLRFYLWILRLAGVTRSDGANFRGLLEYPALRQRLPVELGEADGRRVEEIVAGVSALEHRPLPPKRHPRRDFCRKCAYEDLCYG